MQQQQMRERAAPHPTIPDLFVTTCGRLFTPRRELRPSTLANGYLRVNLKRGGKQQTLLVHRAMAETWLPNPDGLPYVNHIDGDKQHNDMLNLGWVTPSQNAQHAWDTGLVKAYTRNDEHREALARIARTQPRGRRGHCIASTPVH
jgi:hypothetical protein